MQIICVKCKQSLWIGQGDTLYYGEEETMQALNKFLVTHRSKRVPEAFDDIDREHILVYADDMLLPPDWEEEA